MGLFGTIINIKNMVTGGSAKVKLEIASAKIGEPFNITMRVQVADDDLKIEGAYLQIQGVEEIELPHKRRHDHSSDQKISLKNREEIIRSHSVTSEQKIKIVDSLKLEANEEYEWNAVAEVAPNNPPVYNGKYCTHRYRVKAYVDCYGNDPDSGWVNLSIV